MRKWITFTLLFLSFTVASLAQDTPAAEIFGGYSYLRLNDTGPEGDASANLNGWNASVAINANRWAGFVADFGGYYQTNEEFEAKLKIHSFLFGPRFTARMDRISPFAQVLFGASRFSANSIETNEEYSAGTDFTVSFGGGVDIAVNDMLSIRPAQFEYVGLKDNEIDKFSNSFRYSAGIVIRLGSR